LQRSGCDKDLRMPSCHLLPPTISRAGAAWFRRYRK
jgi:hypothetical protein